MEKNTENEEKSCCYICCDDKDGEELLCGVCSCRGGNGHCHLSCLVENGKAKLLGAVNSDDYFNWDLFYLAWWKCPVCKQNWTRDIFRRMSDEFTTFVSKEFPDDLELKVAALRFKLTAVDASEKEPVSSELVEACHKVLDTTGRMTENVHDGLYMGYKSLGSIASKQGDATKTVKCYTDCRALIEGTTGNTWRLMEMDVLIARAETMIPGVDEVSAWKATVPLHEDFYELTKLTYGERSDAVLYAGDLLALALRESDQLIRCARQLNTTYQIARLLHGIEHPVTQDHKDNLESVKKRYAGFISEQGSRLLVVVEYDAASDSYLLKRVGESENTVFRVSASLPDIILIGGTPAVCHGFVDENKHLNGKLGELSDFDVKLCQYVIYFEDDNVQPIKIKAENFRIVFDLPP